MSDNKISEATPIAWVDIANWREELEANDCFFTDYQDEDTIPVYLHPQPAELAEQQEFIADVYKVASTPGMTPVDLADWVHDALLKDGYALAATGKQQVGEAIQDDRFPGGFDDAIAYVNELEELAEALHEKVFGHESDDDSGASTILQMTLHQLNEKHEQVGEVQGDARAQFEAWTKKSEELYDLARYEEDPDRYLSGPTRKAWEAWQAALAARQPVAGKYDQSAEDRFEQFVQAEIARSPDALREVGEYLGRVLDEDGFPQANSLLLQLATEYAAPPAQGIDLGQFRKPVEFFIAYTFPGTPSHAEGNRLLALIEQRDAAQGV